MLVISDLSGSFVREKKRGSGHTAILWYMKLTIKIEAPGKAGVRRDTTNLSPKWLDPG